MNIPRALFNDIVEFLERLEKHDVDARELLYDLNHNRTSVEKIRTLLKRFSNQNRDAHSLLSRLSDHGIF